MSDPPYMQALKGEYGWMKFGWFRSYHAKYMVDGRFKPVIHVITFVMCLGYLMEYPHLKRTRPRPGGLGGGHGAAPPLPHLLPRRPRLASPRPLLPESCPPTLPRHTSAPPLTLCLSACAFAHRREARRAEEEGARCARGRRLTRPLKRCDSLSLTAERERELTDVSNGAGSRYTHTSWRCAPGAGKPAPGDCAPIDSSFVFAA